MNMNFLFIFSRHEGLEKSWIIIGQNKGVGTLWMDGWMDVNIKSEAC